MTAPVMNRTTTPADTLTPKPITASDWQTVIDIIDNPFIKPCQRDTALLERGLMIIRV